MHKCDECRSIQLIGFDCTEAQQWPNSSVPLICDMLRYTLHPVKSIETNQNLLNVCQLHVS